jgi:hypothetical protein
MVELLPLVARYGPKTFNGPLKFPHLGELGMLDPDFISDQYTRLFQTLPSDDYVNFMNSFPVEEVAEGTFKYWRIAGNNDKTVQLIDWSDTLGNKPARVGQNMAIWYMYFAEQFFDVNDVIVGHDPDSYYIQVRSVEREATNRYKYAVALITDDPMNQSVPDSELTIGNRWSKETNFQSGERSYTGTQAHFTTFIEMKARTGAQRMKYVIDGNMMNAGTPNIPLAFALPDPKDPTSTKPYTGAFINFYDAVAVYQFRKQQARAFLFSHKNYNASEQYYNIDDKNGCTIQTFAGMLKQISNTNYQPFSTLNLDKIVDNTIEMGLAYKMQDQYYVDIETGTYGRKDISQWLEAKSTQYTPNFTQDRIKGNASMGGNGLTLGGVFTEYKSYNGVNIRVVPRPFFDDSERYKEKHFSGYGLNSSRNMLIRNFIGDPGIMRLKVKGMSGGIFNYIPGMRNPFSPGASSMNGGKSMTVSPVDAYEVHGMDFIGCMVKDPTKVLYMPYNA